MSLKCCSRVVHVDIAEGWIIGGRDRQNIRSRSKKLVLVPVETAVGCGSIRPVMGGWLPIASLRPSSEVVNCLAYRKRAALRGRLLVLRATTVRCGCYCVLCRASPWGRSGATGL